ncbi:uncharacterized protein LOC117332886 [Pecten maximus]|uniref:uncharacterized protein LOC117332886 n=1 Tax=Pecten maximus TaxID=6579 RepID=UPI001457F9EB|nr:uncharacterized protein LOC117332886 [Pecten maximus]
MNGAYQQKVNQSSAPDRELIQEKQADVEPRKSRGATMTIDPTYSQSSAPDRELIQEKQADVEPRKSSGATMTIDPTYSQSSAQDREPIQEKQADVEPRKSRGATMTIDPTYSQSSAPDRELIQEKQADVEPRKSRGATMTIDPTYSQSSAPDRELIQEKQADVEPRKSRGATMTIDPTYSQSSAPDRELIQEKQADVEPRKSSGATMTIDPTYSQSSAQDREPIQEKQADVEPRKSRGATMTIDPTYSKSPVFDGEQSKQKQATPANADLGTGISFKARNDIDITRKASKGDILNFFARCTGKKQRVRDVKIKKGCVLVCIDITAAGNQSEPSSLDLAEEFKHYLLDGGTIQLSDESRTVLDVDEESFEITPHNAPEDGIPFVNISHAKFVVLVGKTVIIQTYVIASPKATSIEWFKIEDDNHIPIEIDNKIYFGGSVLSPTLIIRETNIDDQGQYMCTATNSNGTGSGNITVLSIQSGNVDALSDNGIGARINTDEDVIGKDADAVMEDVGSYPEGVDDVMEGVSADRKEVDIKDVTDATKLISLNIRGNVDTLIDDGIGARINTDEDVIGRDADAVLEDVDSYPEGVDDVMEGVSTDRKDVDIKDDTDATKLIPLNFTGCDRGESTTYWCYQEMNFDLNEEQKQKMQDLCDIPGHQQRLKQHEKMIMLSITTDVDPRKSRGATMAIDPMYSQSSAPDRKPIQEKQESHEETKPKKRSKKKKRSLSLESKD